MEKDGDTILIRLRERINKKKISSHLWYPDTAALRLRFW